MAERVRILANKGVFSATALILLFSACREISPDSSGDPGAFLRTDGVDLMSRIGGEGEHPLFQVVDGDFMGDTILIAERSSGMVHFFGTDGRGLLSIGGIGDGPGEFRRISWVQVVDEEILVYDVQQNRVTTFTRAGEFVQTTSIAVLPGYGRPAALGVFSDGSLLVAARPAAHSRPNSGLSRADTDLLLYGRSGQFRWRISSFKDSEVFRQPFGQGGQISAVPLFARQSAVAISNDRVLVIENTDPKIRIFGKQGTPLPSIELPAKRRAVSTEDWAAARNRFLGATNRRTQADEILASMPIPDSTPYFGWESRRRIRFLKASPTGEVWVLGYGPTGERGGPVWSVIRDSDGALSNVSFPELANLLDAGKDRALVQRWDSLDIETVEVWKVDFRGDVNSKE